MGKDIKVKQCLVSVLGACLLMLPMTTYAIDKDKHPIVTKRAINTFNQCLKYIDKEKYKLSMVRGGVISKYTKLEDESPVSDRAFNWHFHDAFHGTDHSLKSPYFVMKPSLHDIFNERVQALSYVDNEELDVEIDYDVYLNETKEQISGRIIHYIQDMGIPAHVSPIYHSKPEGWFQELFVDDDPDSFDGLFTKDNIDSLGSLKVNQQNCEELYEKSQKQSMSLVKVLDDFAAETRRRINGKINGEASDDRDSKSWREIFWPVRTSSNGYKNDKFAHDKKGKYGFLKRHDNIFSLQSGSCNGQHDACLAFFKQQYLSIRDNTVLALMMIFIK